MTDTMAKTPPAARPVGRAARPRRVRNTTGHAWAGVAFVAPFLLYLVIFLIYPTLDGFVMSLQRWESGQAQGFDGLANYVAVTQDDIYRSALVNTAVYVLAAVFVIVPLALFLALGVNARWMRGHRFMQIALFVPAVLAPVVVALIWGVMFSRAGPVNAALEAVFGVQPTTWLDDPTWARYVVAGAMVWKWTGFVMVYFLAGLQGIPQELYDAAAIDRAGRVATFRHVTLPSLRPVTLFVLIIVIAGASQLFDEPRLLARGSYGPNNTIVSVANYVFDEAFTKVNFGMASAAALIVLVVVIVTSLLLMRRFENADEGVR